MISNNLHHLHVDGYENKWYICWPDGDAYAGPYKTSAAAKSELTKLKRSI